MSQNNGGNNGGVSIKGTIALLKVLNQILKNRRKLR
jgi:hypothetical protein